MRAWIVIAGSLMVACGGEQPSEVPLEVPAPPLAERAPTPETERPAPETADEGVTTEEAATVDTFLGEPDAPFLASLREGEIGEIERGRGGRSLAFRVTLPDGRRGYFKPEQSFSAAHWYSEVAAYHLDRELGFGRVPPVTGRRLPWGPLRAVAGEDERVSEVRVAADGTVRGAFVGWIEGGVPKLRLGRGWERWVRVRPFLPITPYQRPVDYRSRINGRAEADEVGIAANPAASEQPPSVERACELSDLILFDFLTSNVDRWSPDYTNVRTRGDDGPLIFLDNGAGFWLGRNRLGLMDARLRALQRFRRATVAALREFDPASFRARLEADPLAPVLNEFQIAGVTERVTAAIDHIEALEGEHGDGIYLD